MQFEIVKTWDREWPEAWETALRSFSPISREMPWLAGRWFPMRREINGVWQDCGRYLLSECVPVEILPDETTTQQEMKADLLRLLNGPKPSSLPREVRPGVEVLVNDYQWEMYRKYNVHARELWVIQGDAGGHATYYDPTEQEIRRIHGLPVDPPALGDLSYAPFDNRVIRQMERRNRLVACNMTLQQLRASGSAAALAAEIEEAEQRARAEFIRFITEQSRASADLITWYSGKSDHRDDLPAATPAEISSASAFAEQYVETGHIPTAA